ncbi:MAG: response regulator [Chloroflexia bacterium]
MRGPPSLLVVDDDEPIRDLLISALEGEGYRVVVARDGEEAWAKVQQVRPDMILLDLQMPRMTGWAFIKQAEAEGISVPIVVMSALVNTTREAQELGAVDCLSKPFDLNDLINMVASYVPPSPSAEGH